LIHIVRISAAPRIFSGPVIRWATMCIA
jgi:hypothetical protein